MIFVDEARISVQAGDGGNGCESFYRDKRMRHPRPDGGDGGAGGNIVFKADKSIHTLLDYRYKQHYKAAKGGHASSKGKTGRRGQDCILLVPVGTVIKDFDTNLLIRELLVDGQSVVVANGGKGGCGNEGNRTPTLPQPGEKKTIHLELKIIADVGIIGFPNAGKSTLVSAISKVRSKIANYPFTTKQPVLGMVQDDECNFVVADLPGLIEGAHAGRGLGDRFLKHAERTKILIHLVDMSGCEGRDPLDDFNKINEELQAYGRGLDLKPRIVVANKMDAPESRDHLKRFKLHYRDAVLEVSALEKSGLDMLIQQLKESLKKSEV